RGDQRGHRQRGEARSRLPDGTVRAHRLHRRGHQLPRRGRVLRRVQGGVHGSASAPAPDVPRRPARDEDWQGFLRVRRAGEAQAVDAHERTTLRKAAAWAFVAGLCHLVAPEFAPGFYPSWYFALGAIGYGLLLPLIASLHVRHEPLRRSGAVLGTIAGASVVTLGLGAAANTDLIPAALFVRGVWWWTIGKTWAETGVLPR